MSFLVLSILLQHGHLAISLLLSLAFVFCLFLAVLFSETGSQAAAGPLSAPGFPLEVPMTWAGRVNSGENH